MLLVGMDPQFSKSLEQALEARHCMFRHAAGSADALRHVRRAPCDVIVTDPATSIAEDLAFLEELQPIQVGVRVILLAPGSTPEEIIAALRAHVFLVKCAPFDPEEIAEYALRAASQAQAASGIEVLSARRDWISVRMNCQKLTAERLVEFLSELQTGHAEEPQQGLMMAFREILMNAIEHGGGFHPAKVVEVAAIHTQRASVFYIHDPGAGFRWDEIPHAAVSNPPNAPIAHLQWREELGMRPGGFGILTAKGIVDELIYSECGNEVLLIKHTA